MGDLDPRHFASKPIPGDSREKPRGTCGALHPVCLTSLLLLQLLHLLEAVSCTAGRDRGHMTNLCCRGHPSQEGRAFPSRCLHGPGHKFPSFLRSFVALLQKPELGGAAGVPSGVAAAQLWALADHGQWMLVWDVLTWRGWRWL